MDITELFKASVKTVRTRNRALGLKKNVDDPSRIIGRPLRETKFQTKAKEIVHAITTLQEFHAENRKAYLDVSSQLFGQAPKLSQSDRNEIDEKTGVIIKNCKHSLQELKKDTNYVSNPQTTEHRQMVLTIIEMYLNKVSKMFIEQKNLHEKRQQDMQKVAKLETSTFGPLRKSSFVQESFTVSENLTESVRTQLPYDDDVAKDEQINHFTGEELEMFDKENAMLFNELNSLDEEVKLTYRRAVNIAELQQNLTENILQQDVAVEKIAVTTVGTTENIREGNEHLRQSLQSNSGFRIAIIFFILVLFFSLLFLDWYND